MRRRHPLAAMIVAVIASVGLTVATGCGGDDADDAGEAVESVATEATEALPDDGTAPGTEGATTAAPDDGGGTAPSGGGQDEDGVLEIPADESDLAFQVDQVTAPAGPITLRMPNPAPLPHNIAVDEPEKRLGEIVPQGGVSEISLTFPAGEYEYYCSVPGHREAGMVGTLTVE